MHAVSLTPHAQCIRCHAQCMFVNDTTCTTKFSNKFQKLKSYAKQRWYEKKIKNACGVNDTPCTIDLLFERPWQPLKGISIKNLYVPELSYLTTKKIYKFKWATQKKIFMHAVSLTSHARFWHSKIHHISANLKQNSKRLCP
jgi:hypothetical protein